MQIMLNNVWSVYRRQLFSQCWWCRESEVVHVCVGGLSVALVVSDTAHVLTQYSGGHHWQSIRL